MLTSGIAAVVVGFVTSWKPVWSRRGRGVHDLVTGEITCRARDGVDRAAAGVIIRAVTHPTLALAPLAELSVRIDAPIEVGRVPGGRRRIIPITGGTVSGRLEGTVLPGGADWALQRDDGTTAVSATYPVRTADGTVLTITNQGTITVRDGVPLGLTSIRIEAPEGPWAFLNTTPVVGSLALSDDNGRIVVDLRFYTVEAELPAAPDPS